MQASVGGQGLEPAESDPKSVPSSPNHGKRAQCPLHSQDCGEHKSIAGVKSYENCPGRRREGVVINATMLNSFEKVDLPLTQALRKVVDGHSLTGKRG